MPNMILVNVFGLPSELTKNVMVDLASCIHAVLNDGLINVPREERMINIVFVENMLDKFVQPGSLISIEVKGFNYKVAELWFREQMQYLVDHIMLKVLCAGYSCGYVECRLHLPDSTESLVIGTSVAVTA